MVNNSWMSQPLQIDLANANWSLWNQQWQDGLPLGTPGSPSAGAATGQTGAQPAPVPASPAGTSGTKRRSTNFFVILHEFHMAQLERQKNKVDAATHRLTQVRDLLRAANDALTELTTLQISVSEKASQKDFKEYADKNKPQMQKVNQALVAYQSAVHTVLNPSPGTPGTVMTDVPGRGSVPTYNPPFTGVRMPDLSFLGETTAPLAARLTGATTPVVTGSSPGMNLPDPNDRRGSGTGGSNSGPVFYQFDTSEHKGLDIAKAIKILQTDSTALGQTFQLESGEGGSAVSTHNAFMEAIKSLQDKYFPMIDNLVRGRAS